MNGPNTRALLAEALLDTITTELPGLNLSGARVLIKAALNPGLSVTELNDACGLKFGTGSTLILNMSRFAIDPNEPYGLLELRRHPKARQKAVHLTPYGHTKVAAILMSLGEEPPRIDAEPYPYPQNRISRRVPPPKP